MSSEDAQCIRPTQKCQLTAIAGWQTADKAKEMFGYVYGLD